MGKRLYSEKREVFRELLKQARLEACITQTELARMLSKPQSYVSDYERGHRRLDWVAVDEILAKCGTDLANFARKYQAATRNAS